MAICRIIADKFEEDNPGVKVKGIEGLRPIRGNHLRLDEESRRVVLQAALQDFVLKEWRCEQEATDDDESDDARARYLTALNILMDLGA